MGEGGPSSGRPRVFPLRKEPNGGSDASLKKDVSELGGALDAVRALRPARWPSDAAPDDVVALRRQPGGGSDATLKDDVVELDDGLEAVLALRPVTWRWKDERDGVDLQYGFIAQEVEEVIPELVSEETWNDGTTRKFLNTGDMVPYLVKALKEQQAQIDRLQNIVDDKLGDR